jgi:hypothetical protein
MQIIYFYSLWIGELRKKLVAVWLTNIQIVDISEGPMMQPIYWSVAVSFRKGNKIVNFCKVTQKFLDMRIPTLSISDAHTLCKYFTNTSMCYF